jgi:hypothetical protein
MGAASFQFEEEKFALLPETVAPLRPEFVRAMGLGN